MKMAVCWKSILIPALQRSLMATGLFALLTALSHYGAGLSSSDHPFFILLIFAATFAATAYRQLFHQD
ncbi:hypothetical protein [Chitinilyticum piscinae]|uniref:Uncharacterized protein n=1 Tax=Chitinilyticum piscinae TaxID=2866724 RepID=A0A8J7K1G8_9NEIS|nr:hypothetical protein [Chitinilyticum piscinae]MBE9609176.1 hypothetical protein [Chitinilyticum piscinae]